jgi:hypothetical protein
VTRTQPAPTRATPSASSLDRSGERALREEIRLEIARMLGERQLLEPGPEDEARIRSLIQDRVAAYQRRAATPTPLSCWTLQAWSGVCSTACCAWAFCSP